MKNEGSVDRIVRIVLGLAILSLVFIGPQTVWGWIGVIPLMTGFLGICPLYRMLGLNTAKHDQ